MTGTATRQASYRTKPMKAALSAMRMDIMTLSTATRHLAAHSGTSQSVLGLWVSLCHYRCHQEGNGSVHKNRESDLHIKRIAQMKAMEAYQWDTVDFIREFGRNYLED